METTQYLTFSLNDECFALDVAHVREILEFTGVTKVPKTPEFMKGVINLRGRVVPVMDMKVKFGLPPVEKTVNTCIIVAEVLIDDEMTVLGALVDSVQEVFELEQGGIEPPPRVGTGLNTEFIRGMARRDDRFIIILDIEKIFSMGELLEAKETAA